MLSTLFSNPFVALLQIISLVIALTIHEFSHAWMADHLGDPTPRLQGRLTLNPIRHLDPIGTLLLLVAGFGWGKPVEFDPYNLKRPQRDTTLIALAGPVSNLLLATILAITLRTIGMAMPTFLISTFIFTIFMNITLAIFNLIPIHPLDGGKVLIGILPPETGKDLDLFLHQYGFIILIFLIFPFGNSQSPVSYLIRPIISGIANFLLPM
ncbi:MAG: Peptidase M50 [Candidatus Amesbacteria bacterium GW2011_GWA2_42_12]|uniref:Peptidase M50 n=1 Tax=Candidatus Amesbacteria bacterium GW2011_GWA2_42_12 TaxID=1618356 RepID=A0A0G1A966_9BACT|nr:MAG: Peptidase M50 [Candidatus Amesbacteria bacterium GW2011_GWA2_42_12]